MYIHIYIDRYRYRYRCRCRYIDIDNVDVDECYPPQRPTFFRISLLNVVFRAVFCRFPDSLIF